MEQNQEEKTIYGALTIFYKKTKEGLIFLVVKNAETGNISFVGGAQEEGELSLEACAQRENFEELGLQLDQYVLKEVDIRHEFIFGPSKKERVGYRASYQVFVSDLTNAAFVVSHTQELHGLRWVTEKEVMESLTFSDLVEVFKKTVEIINV